MISLTIKNCARCGTTHERLEFFTFERPIKVELAGQAIAWTHWASCPVSNDPILLRVPDGRDLGPNEIDAEVNRE